MKKNKLVIIILVACLLIVVSGCNKSKSIDDSTNKSNYTSQNSEVKVDEVTTEEDIPTSQAVENEVDTVNKDEISMEAYKKFFDNEISISFDRFMPKDCEDGNLYKTGNEYTLAEVLDIVNANYFKNSENGKIKSIDYSYIDCGNDGTHELAIKFNGMDIYDKDDDSSLVYIVKYINEKLYLCYCYETWARCDVTLNEYGYCKSGGSNGASNHMTEYSLIDEDGVWKFIVSIESELDINQLAWSNELSQIPKVAENKELTGKLELKTICFDNEIINKNKFYTFYVYDSDWKQIEDANLYISSIYKDILNEAQVSFIAPKEVTNMILEKEYEIGLTTEIKEGKEITWEELKSVK